MTVPLRAACVGECMIELSGIDRCGAARLGFGGDTLNTAVYLARELAGAGVVDYVTALGDDPFSSEMVDDWSAEGLATGLVFRLAGALPGLYAIRTDPGGERSFHYWRRDAAARRLLDDGRDALLAASLSGHDLVYLSGITLAILEPAARVRLLRLLDALVGAGVPIAFDTNYRPRLWRDAGEAGAAMEQVGARCRYVLPSAEDDAAIFADPSPAASAARWRALGADEVVVRSGAAGCLIARRGASPETVPATAVETVVDTTAAGDSFNGAYLAARLLGLAPTPAARRAHAVAARVITHPGAIVPAE